MNIIPDSPGANFSPGPLEFYNQPLYPMFAPRTVAVIGATERPNSIGRTVLWNLISSSFGGTVFPINPSRPNVMGIKAYPNIAAAPEPIDLAVVATPAETVPGVVGECAAAGVKGAIVISAGFKETGAQGAELEKKVLERARSARMRIIGPNCLGVMSPLTGLNATFARRMALPGNVGFLSQSGALCTAILDWSFRANVGFSAFVSIGSMLDVGWGDLIDFLGDDRRTESIVIYMETIGDARAFLSAAREVALSKPIIVIKAGRTEKAAKAAASHTGSLAGSDEALDAAFRRCGVLRVESIDELFYMAQALSKQPRPKGPRLAVLTNAGGPGVIAADALIHAGGELARLSEQTLKELDGILPPSWSRGNPVDILGDASPQRYAQALRAVAKEPNADGLLVILTPQAVTDPTQTAEYLKPFGATEGKPVLASWMGGADVLPGLSILHSANIPTFPYPDLAARAFNYMWRYSFNLSALYETPMFPADSEQEAVCVENVAENARKAGRTLLTEFESKQFLACYGIPCVETRLVHDEAEAAEAAGELGYPVVLKLNSETLTHKSDVGGVQLDLWDAAAVRKAYYLMENSVRNKAGSEHFQGATVQPMAKTPGYEVILGSSVDPQLGPILLFGAGGKLVEIFRDRALGLPPLNTTLARRMMERTQIYKALKGTRGQKAADLPGLERLLVKFSQLVAEQRWVKEIDINPLLVSADRIVALDARVALHDASVTEDLLPRLAVRPYPSQYQSSWTTRDGIPVSIRPIRPDDEPLIVKFHEPLSERSVYFYFFHPMKLSQRTAHERLARICFLDYDRQISLVAVHTDPRDGERRILGVGRLIRLRARNEAEFALIVGDDHQRQGLGTELLRRLIAIGREEKLARIIADILPDNRPMQRVCEKLGFRLRRSADDPMIKACIDL
ncbi:MAG: bifunctional acetate--CoA ligase family protein/GNAT family N-acetyltransferase [Nitrospinae bacterium]|nr:bifunctional acetate--CoA ligase family protein/GNAT family N-acetyltransferase [Nitrospinota bacterium]